MTHPIITLEAHLTQYIKQQLARAATWLREHRPVPANFRALMFNKPAPDAVAQIFTWRGISVANRFFGTVTSYDAVKVAPPPRQTVLP